MQAEPSDHRLSGRKKPLRLLALLCALCLLLTGCAKVDKLVAGMILYWMIAQNDNSLTQTQIESLILENKDALEESILTGKAEEWEGRLGIQSVYTDAEGHVDFDCGSWGIVPSGGYTGFYYSPDDQPFDIRHFTDGPLIPLDGGWVWQQEGGDNAFRTQRVAPLFFCYEYHF